MPDDTPLPAGDNTPTWSRQQLLQTLWQFAGGTFAVLTPLLVAKVEMDWRMWALVIGAGVFNSGWTYGGSFVKVPGARKA